MVDNGASETLTYVLKFTPYGCNIVVLGHLHNALGKHCNIYDVGGEVIRGRAGIFDTRVSEIYGRRYDRKEIDGYEIRYSHDNGVLIEMPFIYNGLMKYLLLYIPSTDARKILDMAEFLTKLDESLNMGWFMEYGMRMDIYLNHVISPNLLHPDVIAGLPGPADPLSLPMLRREYNGPEWRANLGDGRYLIAGRKAVMILPLGELEMGKAGTKAFKTFQALREFVRNMVY